MSYDLEYELKCYKNNAAYYREQLQHVQRKLDALQDAYDKVVVERQELHFEVKLLKSLLGLLGDE